MKSVYDLVVEMEEIEEERSRIMKFLEKNKATVENLTKLEDLEIRYHGIDKIILEKGIKFNEFSRQEKRHLSRCLIYYLKKIINPIFKPVSSPSSR